MPGVLIEVTLPDGTSDALTMMQNVTLTEMAGAQILFTSECEMSQGYVNRLFSRSRRASVLDLSGLRG